MLPRGVTYSATNIMDAASAAAQCEETSPTWPTDWRTCGQVAMWPWAPAMPLLSSCNGDGEEASAIYQNKMWITTRIEYGIWKTIKQFLWLWKDWIDSYVIYDSRKTHKKLAMVIQEHNEDLNVFLIVCISLVSVISSIDHRTNSLIWGSN